MTDNIIVYGATWCPDCRRAKEFFGTHRIAYEWIDITDNDEAIAFVEQANHGMRRIPTIIFPDGAILVEPSNAELAEKTRVKVDPDRRFYDVIVIGGGPAGLTAAIYTTREGLKTLVIDRAGLGGQVATTQQLDNFPAFEQGISGQEFADRLERQARRFEADIVQGEPIVDITRDGQYLIVTSGNNHDYAAHAVIIATGSRYKRLNIPGEAELIGTNVHFCATCDGPFYKGKDVLVIGGGNSGFEEGLHLATIAKSVTIVEFLPEVKASRILQDKVAAQANMQVVTNHAVREFRGKDDNRLDAVVVEDRASGELKEWHPDGVFVFIGLSPNSGFLPETIERDEWGFIRTSSELMTSMPGVVAAGDVRAGSTKQAISAAGEGATAALMVRQYLQAQGEANPINTIERETLVTGR